MDIDALKTGLYAAVRAEIPAMHCPDNPLQMPVPPTFVVYDFDIAPHKTFGYLSEVDMTARLIIGRGDPQSGGQMLRGYMGDATGTIFHAIAAPLLGGTGAQTFGGACSGAYVTRIRGYRQYNYDGTPFIGCEFVIHCVGERATP